MKDWRGMPIYVGDTVVYPGRQSSSLWMNEGVVVAVEEGTPDAANYWDRSPHMLRVRRQFDSGYRSRKNGDRVNAERVVVVQAQNVTVVTSRIKTHELGEDMTIEIDGRAS